MKKLDDYQKYLPILSKAKLFEGIPLEHYPQIFNFLQASILSFEKDELIQHLGEPLLYSGIVLDGTVEGSFINENYSKINMNHFERGRSFAEALACVQTPYSPIPVSYTHLDVYKRQGHLLRSAFKNPLPSKMISLQVLISEINLWFLPEPTSAILKKTEKFTRCV